MPAKATELLLLIDVASPQEPELKREGHGQEHVARRAREGLAAYKTKPIRERGYSSTGSVAEVSEPTAWRWFNFISEGPIPLGSRAPSPAMSAKREELD